MNLRREIAVIHTSQEESNNAGVTRESGTAIECESTDTGLGRDFFFYPRRCQISFRLWKLIRFVPEGHTRGDRYELFKLRVS